MQQGLEQKREGAITVYMALTLTVLLSLFVFLISEARSRAVELVASCGVDLGVYSVFAEYNRELFEEYDLLFVDTSYGKDRAGDQMKQRLAYYIEENLSKGKVKAGIGTDLLQTELSDLQIKECSYATDEKGEIFYRQAAEFMKQTYGVSYLRELEEELAIANENDLFTRDVTSEREQNQRRLDELKEEGVPTGEVDENGNPVTKPVEFDNPADSVNASRSLGVLNLVTDASALSYSGIRAGTQLSSAMNHSDGNGLCGRKHSTTADGLWFCLYLREHCGSFRQPKETGVLQYQMEYILEGKDNDVDNLKAVVTKLLALRETANVVYLFSDAAKMGEAEALAASIATAAGLPVLTEPIKISLLFAWAWAESVWDVRCLLAGRSVKILKTSQDWHCSLSGLLGDAGGELPPQEETDRSGLARISRGELGYEEYLLLFLSMEGKQTKLNRMMDLAELDVRKNSGDYGFFLSDCMEYLTVEALVTGRKGGSKTVRRNFSYDG
ncbi:MAG: DUF5702 domain-containing protein [Lachnospiraceae bacterium]|nr:DUF5702 domain-containing protein [Lachnospiraceae bacterium]